MGKSTVHWKKSSFSDEEAECVEVAMAGGAVLVRHSWFPDQAVISIAPTSWLTFVDFIKTAPAAGAVD